MRDATEAAGATHLLLPLYSPGFSPVEQPFAKLKAWLRKAAAGTKAALWQAIAQARLPSHPPNAPGQRHALLLPDGQLPRLALEQMLDVERTGDVADIGGNPPPVSSYGIHMTLLLEGA